MDAKTAYSCLAKWKVNGHSQAFYMAAKELHMTPKELQALFQKSRAEKKKASEEIQGLLF